MKKQSSKKFLTYMLSVVLLMIALFVSMPFMHNHEPDLHAHDDCPSHLMFTFFTSVIISLFVIIFTYIFVEHFELACAFFFFIILNFPIFQLRAPPQML